MRIHPSPNFPLLASDQADVIRIYLELMRDWNGTEPAATTEGASGRLQDSHDAGYPGELAE